MSVSVHGFGNKMYYAIFASTDKKGRQQMYGQCSDPNCAHNERFQEHIANVFKMFPRKILSRLRARDLISSPHLVSTTKNGVSRAHDDL